VTWRIYLQQKNLNVSSSIFSGPLLMYKEVLQNKCNTT